MRELGVSPGQRVDLQVVQRLGEKHRAQPDEECCGGGHRGKTEEQRCFTGSARKLSDKPADKVPTAAAADVISTNGSEGNTQAIMVPSFDPAAPQVRHEIRAGPQHQRLTVQANAGTLYSEFLATIGASLGRNNVTVLVGFPPREPISSHSTTLADLGLDRPSRLTIKLQ